MSNARSRLAAYGRTPKELLRDPRIRPIAKIVYAMVDEVAGHEDVTMERLAEWLGVNVKTARRALHEIAQAGWVEVGTVVEAQRGQVASEYVANAYPFQHLSEAEDISSAPQVSDQAERSAPLPLSSGPVEKSGTPPYQKVPSTPVEQTGVPKSGTPRASQKVVAPSLRDDETKKIPSTSSISNSREKPEPLRWYPEREYLREAAKRHPWLDTINTRQITEQYLDAMDAKGWKYSGDSWLHHLEWEEGQRRRRNKGKTHSPTGVPL